MASKKPTSQLFGVLGLCNELLQAVEEQGYVTPSDIQQQAIPAVLEQQDVMAVARTGTGKTAAFTLPILQLLSVEVKEEVKQVRALVITPTRELAAQVAQSVQHYARHLNISAMAVFGGVRIEPQIAQLSEGVDVLVATPGRLVDLYNQQTIDFTGLEILVMDEADRMLDLGFIDDIRHIQTLLPAKRQTLMFSATFSSDIKHLAQGMLNNPQLIEVAAPNSMVDTVNQKIYSVDKTRKSEVLKYLIKKHRWQQMLVFCRTKQGADNLVSELEKANIRGASIHANRTQHARIQALEGFKSGDISVLVATDIASRGIDINQLACVVNFDLPYVAEDYVHRIGRTGRAGNLGLAVTLFSEDELKQLQSIERLIGVKFQVETISGFEPTMKTQPGKADDDEYGNFEADIKPHNCGKSKGRGKAKGRGNAAKRNDRNDWKKQWL